MDVVPDRSVGNSTTPLPLLTSTTNGSQCKGDVRLRPRPLISTTNGNVRKSDATMWVRPHALFLPPTQCRGRVTPLPSLFSISTSIPNSASERMLSGPRCLPARGNKTMEPRDDEAAGYNDGSLHISAASLAPFMMHHSCIRPNGSTRRGKH